MYVNPTIKYHHNAIFSTSTGSQATPEIPAHTDQQSEKEVEIAGLNTISKYSQLYANCIPGEAGGGTHTDKDVPHG